MFHQACACSTWQPWHPLQAEAEDLDEAGNEVMLLDDETAPYAVGECLVHLPREEVEERLQQGGEPWVLLSQ